MFIALKILHFFRVFCAIVRSSHINIICFPKLTQYILMFCHYFYKKEIDILVFLADNYSTQCVWKVLNSRKKHYCISSPILQMYEEGKVIVLATPYLKGPDIAWFEAKFFFSAIKSDKDGQQRHSMPDSRQNGLVDSKPFHCHRWEELPKCIHDTCIRDDAGSHDVIVNVTLLYRHTHYTLVIIVHQNVGD